MTVPSDRFTVEERAARWQRRFTGPWQTHSREIGPVDVSWRARRRVRLEFVELAVAGHDLWIHALLRGAVLPLLRRLVRSTHR